jgi:hypothetical protein
MTGASLTTRTLKAKDPKLAIMKFYQDDGELEYPADGIIVR